MMRNLVVVLAAAGLLLQGVSLAMAGTVGSDRASREAERTASPPAEPPVVEAAPEIHGYRTTLSPDFKPKVLPLSVLETEKDYLASALPIAMVVAADASFATYWFCDDPRDCAYDLEKSLGNAIRYCENLSVGETCFVHSVGRARQNPDLTYGDTITYKSVPAEEQSRHGAEKAVGKIVYLPGFSGWSYEKPNFWPKLEDGRVSPLLHDLNDRGWDVDVVNFLHYGRYMFYDDDAMFARVIGDLARAAKQEGYRRFVVIGSSRGGSEAIRAATAGAQVDGLILIEPDWHGPKHNRDGTARENYAAEKMEALAAYLKMLRTPRLGMLFFAKSDWFGDITPEDMARALADQTGPVFLLARPKGYTSHFAAGTDRFAREYGACLDSFLKGVVDRVEDCVLPELDPQDIANWASVENLPLDLEPVGGEKLYAAMQGGGTCPYDFRKKMIRTDQSCTFFERGERSLDAVPHARRLTRFVSEIEYTDTGYCKLDAFGAQTTDRGCLKVFRRGDFYILQRSDNDAVFAYHYVADIKAKPADFICRTGTDGFKCEDLRTDPTTPGRSGSLRRRQAPD